jgi:hypothetical protein
MLVLHAAFVFNCTIRRFHVRYSSAIKSLLIAEAGTCECGNEPSGSIKCGEFVH